MFYFIGLPVLSALLTAVLLTPIAAAASVMFVYSFTSSVVRFLTGRI